MFLGETQEAIKIAKRLLTEFPDSQETETLLRGLRGLDVVAGDVVEVSPPFDPSGVTGLNGAQMMFEILCLLAEGVVARREAGEVPGS